MHYEFTEDTITFKGMTAYRIRATVDIPGKNVEKGHLGGYVCKDSVLSEQAWVGGDATVWQSRLLGNIRVGDDAFIEKSLLTNRCQILDRAHISNSTLAGVSAKDGSKVENSEFILQNSEWVGFMLEDNASVSYCNMTYTADKMERIVCKGAARLVECTVKGKRMMFEGHTLVAHSTIEGEALFFDHAKTVHSLKLTGKQVSFTDIKHLVDVEMKNAFQVTLRGQMTIEHFALRGESIDIIGDEIVIEEASIKANLVKILDAVTLRRVDLHGYDIELTDYVSLMGKSGDPIQIENEVSMRELVSVHTDARKKSSHFQNKHLSGDICLTGI